MWFLKWKLFLKMSILVENYFTHSWNDIFAASNSFENEIYSRWSIDFEIGLIFYRWFNFLKKCIEISFYFVQLLLTILNQFVIIKMRVIFCVDWTIVHVWIAFQCEFSLHLTSFIVHKFFVCVMSNRYWWIKIIPWIGFKLNRIFIFQYYFIHDFILDSINYLVNDVLS